MNTKLLALIVALLLTACGGGGDACTVNPGVPDGREGAQWVMSCVADEPAKPQ